MVRPIFRSYTVIKDILNYHKNFQCSYNLNNLWKIMHNLLPNIYAHYLHSRSPKLRCQMLRLIFFFTFFSHLTLVLLNLDIPCLRNSVDPDQLASKKPTDLDLHCLQLSMWSYINNLDQVIWLAENLKRAWHLNLFNRTRVNGLIRMFISCILDSEGCKISSCGQWWLWSDCTDVQADLSLRWVHVRSNVFSLWTSQSSGAIRTIDAGSRWSVELERQTIILCVCEYIVRWMCVTD